MVARDALRLQPSCTAVLVTPEKDQVLSSLGKPWLWTGKRRHPDKRRIESQSFSSYAEKVVLMVEVVPTRFNGRWKDEETQSESLWISTMRSSSTERVTCDMIEGIERALDESPEAANVDPLYQDRGGVSRKRSKPAADSARESRSRSEVCLL